MKLAGIGDNSQAVDSEKLLSYVDRLETIAQRRTEVNADFNDVLSEAQALGFDKKVLREVLKIRKMNEEARRDFEFHREAYLAGLDLV